ncbi:Fanconi anemia group F protein [Zootoca vivipara]|uniref:Fanconi anemia group F protein n=1 Tax=Zootoca vivipara TaxID=8524 RepID=UPI00159149CD|nr:Fanconi anemia group F protein [Zootoca vivipara]
METLLSQTELLPSLLAASRSGLVRDWDAAAVRRALSWGRFFQGLHARLPPERGLRASVERRLRSRGVPLGLGHLKRCPELLGLALLENRALPYDACRALLRALLHDGDGERRAHRLARRKAAAQLLLLPSAPPSPHEAPPVRAQGQLLLERLREEGGGEEGALLEQLPCCPTLHRAVAAALLEPGGEAEARAALLPWLLQQQQQPRLAAFFRLLPASWAASLCSRHPELRAPYLSLLAAWGSRLRYDPLRGEWGTGGLEEGAAAPWQEVRERVGCLCQGPEPLRSAVLAQLRDLKAQDGGFEVRGLSVWTDLLLDVQASASKEKLLARSLPPTAK